MAINIKRVVSNFKTTLSSSMTDTATSMTLAAVPAGTIQYPNWFVIEPKSANFEIVYCPTAPSGTTFSGITRGVSASADTDAAGTGLAHPANVDVVLAPMHRMHNSMADVFNGVSAAPAVMLNPTARTISDPRHLVDMEYVASLTSGAVAAFLVTQNGADPSLTINVNAGQFIVKDGTTAQFAGSAAAAVTPSATNYVELNPNTNTLSINTSAFSANNLPLAVVTTSGTDITAVADRRAWLSQNDGLVDKIRTWSTAQTFTADNLQITSDPDSDNDAVRASRLNTLTATINNITTGEAIDGSTTPLVVAIKTSDGLLYKAGANDNTLVKAIGFVTTNASITTTPVVRTSGIITFPSVLVKNSLYYLQDTVGTIGVTPSTSCSIPIGIATSTTTLRILFGKKIASGTIAHSSAGAGTQDVTTTIGFQPSVIIIGVTNITESNGGLSSRGQAVYFGTTRVAGCVANPNGAATALTTDNIHGVVGSYDPTVTSSSGFGNRCSGVLTMNAVSETGFTTRIVNTTLGGAGLNISASLVYTAFE